MVASYTFCGFMDEDSVETNLITCKQFVTHFIRNYHLYVNSKISSLEPVPLNFPLQCRAICIARMCAT